MRNGQIRWRKNSFVLAKNLINRNKLDNTAKTDIKNIDFMPFIQIDINGHIEYQSFALDEVGHCN